MNWSAETYSRFKVSFVKGENCYLWDKNGKKYLDMLSGIGVCNLGHANPQVAQAICEQAKTLIHTSNLFEIEVQDTLARMICENSFGKKVFFANSGAEAVEGGLKFARKWGAERGKWKILAFENSFHGRTFGALSITGQEKHRKGFAPLLEGVEFARFNDIDSVKKKLSEEFCAIVVEPIQGEGGVIPAEKEFLEGLKDLSEKLDVLLIFDEVQTGMGRTGKLFAYQLYGVEPDIMLLAKGLGNGVPIGAVVIGERVLSAIKPGIHASTFGGNYLACRAGIEVMKQLLKENFLEEVEKKGAFLKNKLEELVREFGKPLLSVRGKGLMLGIVCSEPCKDVPAKALEEGLIVNCTAGNVIRLLPPLTITYSEIELGVELLKKTLEKVWK